MNLRFNQKFFLISAAALSSLAKNADALDPKVHLASGDTIGIENEWIVVLKPPADGGKRSRKLTVETVEAYAESMDEVEVEEVYHAAIEGFTARMSESAADELAKNDEIESIEQNAVITADAVTWGLDRVDQRALPLNNQYNVEGDGSDVHAYIIDTGIQTSHNEFGGRARWGINTSGDGQNRDCNGHGTHVAGTVGGATYGVAQNVKLVAVKVLNCNGSGSYAGVIRGVEWVMTDAKGKKATANMSLGGGRSDAVNLAVRNLHTSGVPTVVSAGNDNGNACTKSPASERSVITVGSTTNTDIRSSFSNWGECVDLFAPGSSITAAWIGSNTATRTISGTSMASPHVCGGAALLLSAGVAADAIDEELIRKSTLNKVRNPGSQSPNRLLYVGEMGTRAPSPATVAPTPAPTKTPRLSITKKGTATQSSTCYGGNASRAIDGNTNGRYGNRSITHTCRNSKGSWWKVDLEGDNAIIDEIVVWNREDCCSHRLTGSVVEILNEDGNVVSSKTIPTATNVKKFSFEYDGVEGVEVRVRRPGSEYLSLAEVEVFGTIVTDAPTVSPAPTKSMAPTATYSETMNLARGGTATQKCVGWGGVPSRAIDGNKSQFWSSRSISHTCITDGAWWQVDLPKEESLIEKIVVWNRLDCCSERLQNSRVEILNKHGNVVHTSTIGATKNIRTFPLALETPVIGATVKVTLNGRNYLQLSEVEVFGKKPIGDAV